MLPKLTESREGTTKDDLQETVLALKDLAMAEVVELVDDLEADFKTDRFHNSNLTRTIKDALKVFKQDPLFSEMQIKVELLAIELPMGDFKDVDIVLLKVEVTTTVVNKTTTTKSHQTTLNRTIKKRIASFRTEQFQMGTKADGLLQMQVHDMISNRSSSFNSIILMSMIKLSKNSSMMRGSISTKTKVQLILATMCLNSIRIILLITDPKGQAILRVFSLTF